MKSAHILTHSTLATATVATGLQPRAAEQDVASAFSVVAVGASAGGLDVFTRLLEGFPAQSGMALILVQHLDPSHKSLLAGLLAGHTRMAVREALHGDQIEPNTVYVIAPGTYLAVEAGTLVVTEPADRHGARMPFDFLLRSLAKAYGDRAIGVVLSGNGSDGAMGLRAIKDAGGLVAAQSPEEAEHKGMPQSAIAAGVVDIILPLEKISGSLAAYAAHIERPGESNDAALLRQITQLLVTRFSQDFSGYKPGTLMRRIRRRMAIHGIGDDADYLAHLNDDEKESEALSKDLLIHVTGFFRDPAVFAHLAAETIPSLVRLHPPGQPLRVWVPACSSGEEVYSLAILFLEEIQKLNIRIQLQIFGSDIDEQAIAQARAGRYPASLKDELSVERLARFFTEDGDGYRISPLLREASLFTVQNILADPPFARLDVVSCRNLLIYLLPEAQQRVLGMLHFALRKDGILVLGVAENVGDLSEGFEAAPAGLRIFRRIGGNRKFSLQFGGAQHTSYWPRRERVEAARDNDLGELSRRLLLDSYAPASVLINRRHEGVFYCGPTETYLQVPQGDASHGIFAMVRPGLRNKLRSAVQRVRDDNLPIAVAEATVRRDGVSISVLIEVRALEGTHQEFLLVSFRDLPRTAAVSHAAGPHAAGPHATGLPMNGAREAELEADIEALQKELQDATRELEASSADQEAINQEAQSLNEEYQSTNEELETSKEELQSLNEELTALNSQLNTIVNQQRTTADDLDNILRSADLAIIFLDSNLNIRFFSDAAKALFGTIDTDLGRPIDDLAQRFHDASLVADIRAVLDKLTPMSREVHSHRGEWFNRRIMPYRAKSGARQGVVLTLSNISTSKVAEFKAAAEHAHIGSIIDTVHQPLVVVDGRLRIVSANTSFCRVFDTNPDDVNGHGLTSIAGGCLDVAAMNTFLDRARAETAAIEDYEIEIEYAHVRTVLMLSARTLTGESVAGRRLLIAIDDITERKLISEALEVAKLKAEKANLGKSRFLAAASHDLRQPLQTLSLLHGVLARKLSDPEAIGLIGKLNETLGAMAGMLDTLLDINQLEAGTVQPEVDDFAVSTVLDQLKTEFGYVARSKGLALRAVGSSLFVRSDPLLLAQMIRNLLSNAVKYTKHGKVLIGCRRHGDKVRIEVCDSGIGIPEGQREAIFEEYYQLDNLARERGLGLGLGLSIVRRVGELLGHEVGLRSIPGKGSIFFIDVAGGGLPQEKPDDGGAYAKPAAARLTGAILIVEDDPMVSDALVLLFKGEGYRTLVATDGRAVAALQDSPGFAPDVVVADYNLPGGASGLEVIERLRAASGRALPAIVLTGDIAADVLRKVVAADCDYLHKPVNVDRLTQRIQDMLSAQQNIPLRTAARPPAMSRDQAVKPVVYLVDDDIVLLESLRETLKARGHSVEIHTSAESFLAAHHHGRTGCLVVDSVMPGMSGLELLRRLKAEDRSLPSVVITGYGDIRLAIKAMNAGAMDFVEKPAPEEVLLASIDRALRQADTATPSTSRSVAAENLSHLTPRERQVMYLVVEGLPNKEIAASLGISQRTVETHRASVMKRTRSASLPDLIRLVMRSV
jgi:two-component system CheB/CheR fusion protein